MHGIGLLNIRRVVSKYDGYFNIDVKEGLFILEVMI
jgi:sensor histidine kinase YesM